MGFAPAPPPASRLGLIPASTLAWPTGETATEGTSLAVGAADCAFAVCVWLAAAKDRPVSSAVGLGVSSLLGAGEAPAGFWEGAEPAVRVRGAESVIWVALWLSVEVLSALVPCVWVKLDWSGDAAVVVPSAVWAAAPLGCSAPCEPKELGTFAAPGTTVGVGAAVGDVKGEAVAVGAVPAGVPSPPRVEGGVRIDPAAEE